MCRDTVCPRSLGPYNIVSYYTKWVKTSWIVSIKMKTILESFSKEDPSCNKIENEQKNRNCVKECTDVCPLKNRRTKRGAVEICTQDNIVPIVRAGIQIRNFLYRT